LPNPIVSKYFNNPALKTLGLYTFTNFFGKGVAFLMLPYFTSVLSREDMGTITLFSNSLLFLIPFVSMGALQSTAVEYFKLDKKEFKNFFTSSVLLTFIFFLASLFVFFIGRQFLITQYKFPAVFVWLIPAATFLSFINQLLVTLVRNEENKKLFSAVVLGRLFLEIIIAVILISGFKKAWRGRVDGIVISFAVMGLYALYFYIRRQYLFGQIKWIYIKEELLFSVPVIAIQFSTFCMNYSDVFFLSRYTHDNNASVGVYGIACVFASITITLSSALLQYMHPKIFKLLSLPQIDYAAIRKEFFLYFKIITAGLLLLLIFVPLAYKYIINNNYSGGLRYYSLLCIAYFFWAVAYAFFTLLLYYKHKRKIFMLSLMFIAVSLLCNFFFIKNTASPMGAATGVFCSYTIVLIITLLVTARQMRFLYKPVLPALPKL
jgi:O-antigen/teichoic acid export membrane protein